MSSPLNPSFAAMTAVRQSIANTLKADIPADLLPNVISTLLTTVNKWGNQIPSILDGPAAQANLVFAVRSDLFVAPRFIQNVFNVPLADLPAAFTEFHAFIQNLIEAQKGDKPGPKACLFHCS